MHLRRKKPMNMGTIEKTSMISKAIAISVVTRSRHTSARPICGACYKDKFRNLISKKEYKKYPIPHMK